MTRKDAIEEKKAAKKISKVLDIKIELTDDFDHVDFILIDKVNDLPFAVAEFKRRYVAESFYNTVFLEKDKRENTEDRAKKLGVIPLFVVQFDDALKLVEIGSSKNFGKPKKLGRYDRGDSRDIDLIYEVDIDSMCYVE